MNFPKKIATDRKILSIHSYGTFFASLITSLAYYGLISFCTQNGVPISNGRLERNLFFHAIQNKKIVEMWKSEFIFFGNLSLIGICIVIKYPFCIGSREKRTRA